MSNNINNYFHGKAKNKLGISHIIPCCMPDIEQISVEEISHGRRNYEITILICSTFLFIIIGRHFSINRFMKKSFW